MELPGVGKAKREHWKVAGGCDKFKLLSSARMLVDIEWLDNGMAIMDKHVGQAVTVGASNVHISTGSPPMMRLHGDLIPMSQEEVTLEAAKTILLEILNEKQKDLILKTYKELDFSYTSGSGQRFRVNIFRQRRGLDRNVMLLSQKFPH